MSAVKDGLEVLEKGIEWKRALAAERARVASAAGMAR